MEHSNASIESHRPVRDLPPLYLFQYYQGTILNCFRPKYGYSSWQVHQHQLNPSQTTIAPLQLLSRRLFYGSEEGRFDLGRSASCLQTEHEFQSRFDLTCPLLRLLSSQSLANTGTTSAQAGQTGSQKGQENQTGGRDDSRISENSNGMFLRQNCTSSCHILAQRYRTRPRQPPKFHRDVGSEEDLLRRLWNLQSQKFCHLDDNSEPAIAPPGGCWPFSVHHLQ